MKAIDVLVREHDVILELLDHLDRGAGKIVGNRNPPREFFESGLGLAREFADRFHHYKEEYVMFGLLAQKHDGRLDGEIERHRNQHEQCRDHIQRISDSLGAYSSELDPGARAVHRNVRDYVTTLRSHIRSENEILFPMVAEALTAEEGESLLTEFERYERKCESTFEDFRVAIATLVPPGDHRPMA